MAIKIMNIEQNTFSDNLDTDKISHSVYIFYLYDSYLLYLQVILSLLDKTLEKSFIITLFIIDASGLSQVTDKNGWNRTSVVIIIMVRNLRSVTRQ